MSSTKNVVNLLSNLDQCFSKATEHTILKYVHSTLPMRKVKRTTIDKTYNALNLFFMN